MQRFQLQISERRLLLMFGDALANALAVLIALRIWALVGDIEYALDFILLNFWWFPVLGSIWFILASANDFYELPVAANAYRSGVALMQITIQMLIVYLLIFFLSPRDALPRLFILYYGVASFGLILLWRLWRPFLIGWTASKRRVLIVGSGWAARSIIEVLKTEAPNAYEIVAVVTDPNTHTEVSDTITVLREGDRLADVAAELEVAEIVLAYGTQLPGAIFQGVMDAYERGLSIIPMPILYEQVTGRIPIEHVGEADWNVVLPIASYGVLNPYPLLKRLLDIVLALFGSFIFAILLPFIALALYIDSPGSIFYRQERVGKGGKPFFILKLRTMVPDAEKLSGPQWASERDPRVTRLGRFFRKTRLDEIPQLVNVLRGEMSLVGPRPERPFFVDKLAESIPFYRTRNVIKPGVTGWAQVKHGYGASVEDSLTKLQYDLYYIRHQSLILDILIILRTVRKMLALAGR